LSAARRQYGGKGILGTKEWEVERDIAASATEGKANSTPPVCQATTSTPTTKLGHHQNLSFTVIKELDHDPDYFHLAQ